MVSEFLSSVRFTHPASAAAVKAMMATSADGNCMLMRAYEWEIDTCRQQLA